MISLHYFDEYLLGSIVLSGTVLIAILYLLVSEVRGYLFPVRRQPVVARAYIPVSCSPYRPTMARRSPQSRPNASYLGACRIARELNFGRSSCGSLRGGHV
ncbi:MAG TPA: hypothetical protein VEL31_03750 [Ktedonobacteraceae bacterium]|nr:hypothetical protein [Ktedonobacteraceae bacterium]